MELRDYITILLRRKWIIMVTLLVTVLVVSIGTSMSTLVFEATSVIRIAVSSGGPLSYQEYVYTDQLMNTYVEMATRRPVVQELMDRLGLNEPPEIKAEIIPSTELIKISVEDTNPHRAADAANTLADILIAQSNQLYVGGGKRLSEVLSDQLTQVEADVDTTRTQYEKLLLQTPPAADEIETTKQALQLQQSNYASLLVQYQQARFREEIQASMITVFETATVPQTPSKPRVTVNMILGFVVGLAGGLGLAFVFENLDTILYTSEDIEKITQVAALAQIPEASKDQLFVFQDSFSPIAEAFRNLATYVQQIYHGQAAKTLMVLSAEPNQGKSLITSQLALCLAESGRKVVVVDCDMRRPTLHRIFMLANECGLSNVLEQKASLDEALQKGPLYDVRVLTSGNRPEFPTKLLASSEMSKLIHRLAVKFDYILLDTPAMLGLADVAAMIQKVDGFLWVVRRSHARREAVEAARKFLRGFSEKGMGLIINHADDGGYYGYYRRRRKGGFTVAAAEQEVGPVPKGTY